VACHKPPYIVTATISREVQAARDESSESETSLRLRWTSALNGTFQCYTTIMGLQLANRSTNSITRPTTAPRGGRWWSDRRRRKNRSKLDLSSGNAHHWRATRISPLHIPRPKVSRNPTENNRTIYRLSDWTQLMRRVEVGRCEKVANWTKLVEAWFKRLRRIHRRLHKSELFNFLIFLYNLVQSSWFGLRRIRRCSQSSRPSWTSFKWIYPIRSM